MAKGIKTFGATNVEPVKFSSLSCGMGFFKRGAAEPDADEMNALIASEMNQLSIKEREAAFEDLHAISKVPNESPESIAQLVSQVRQEASKIREKSAYSKALFLNPRRVNSDEFILRFLRAENYDTRMAANRMVAFFQHKLELFGVEKLSKVITLEDLDEDDRSALASGSIQFLPQKDSAGRTIIFSAQRLKKFKTLKNQLKAAWYLFMSLAEREEVQRNGVVLLFYTLGATLLEKEHIDYFRSSKGMSTSLPLRAAGFHFCYDDAMLRPLVTTLQMIIGRNWRARSRVHYGSMWECSYALSTYGIARESLPVDNDGNICNEFLLHYLNERSRIEEEAKLVPTNLLTPECNDVLLGRGRPFQEFPGNTKLAEIIEGKRETYQQSQRKLQKTAISNDVLRLIKASKGRFLKKHETEEGVWVEVEDEIARDKISHCFRTKARKRPAAPITKIFHPAERKMSIDSDTDMILGYSSSKRGRHSPPGEFLEEIKSVML